LPLTNLRIILSFTPRTHEREEKMPVDFMSAVVALGKEALAVMRAALVDWPVTARLCVIIIVAATTICATALVLR
jgi:hypothetical protein